MASSNPGGDEVEVKNVARVQTMEGQVHHLTAKTLKIFRVLHDMILTLEEDNQDDSTMEEPIPSTSHAYGKPLTIPVKEPKPANEEDPPIILDNISGPTFSKLLEWAEFHKNDVSTEDSPRAPKLVANGQEMDAPRMLTECSTFEPNCNPITPRGSRYVFDDPNGLSLSNPIPQWDDKFLHKLKEQELYDVMNACNFLDVRPLLAMTCKFVASKMHNKSVEQVREMFGIESDYDPEEEERMKKENAWAEDW